jgi:Prokaryotic membrane lipoprotein lipid attachment site
MKKIIAPFLAILILASCNNNDSKKANETATTTTDKPADKPAASGKGGTQMMVTLTGGANAGSYTANSAEATCSMGLTGEKSFGNQYSVSGKADNEFSSLQLLVDDYEAAKSGTDKFYIKVAFGKRLQGNKYEINGSDNSLSGKKQGSGKITITESGSSKIAHVEGKTSDGVSINADITCTSVITMNGTK